MNGFSSTNGLSMPGAGFASRNKTHRPQRLTLASAPKVGSISENSIDGLNNPPRTSRSHLLAGLRTQPRTPGAVPASAPYNKTSYTQHAYSMPTQQHQQNQHLYANQPHTAIGSHFTYGQQQQQFSLTPGQQLYGLPEQVLAPPPLDMDENEEQLDPHLAAQLYATQMYLQERQQQLQQMALVNHMAGLNVNNPQYNKNLTVAYPQTPVTPQQLSMYAQPQIQNHGNGILTQELAGQPGVYVVYNALTGQSTLAVDPATHQTSDLSKSPPPPTPGTLNTKLGHDKSASYDTGSPFGSRSRSPPKKSASPAQDVAPLPPPSANAFRRGHNRNRSSLALNNTGASVADGPKSARPLGIPATPMTGTFGPGHGRAGEHPIRQPIGPPAIEELQKAPTAKFEGSKNFSARQRRRALHTLVRAGLERRIVRPGSGQAESVGSTTPVSGTEQTFSLPSDNDSDSVRSLSEKLALSVNSAMSGESKGFGTLETRQFSQESLASGSVTPAEGKPMITNILVGLGASN